MIDKYYEFLLEKQLYDLILEGKMIFSTDFIEVLDTISLDSSDGQVADLASLIRHYSEKDVNIDTNCIDISDTPGMITFVPSDKVKDDELIYRILTRCDVLEYHPSSPHTLFRELDVPGEGLINLHPRSLIYDNWLLIKKETPVNYNLDFLLFTGCK